MFNSPDICTVTVMTKTSTNFTRQVAGSVRAELARASKAGTDLLGVLPLSRNSIYSRLRGEKAFELNELELIASYLNISERALLMSEQDMRLSA